MKTTNEQITQWVSDALTGFDSTRRPAVVALHDALVAERSRADEAEQAVRDWKRRCDVLITGTEAEARMLKDAEDRLAEVRDHVNRITAKKQRKASSMWLSGSWDGEHGVALQLLRILDGNRR